MDHIENWLAEYLQSNHLICEKIYFYNAYKGRYTLLASNGTQKLVIKANSPEKLGHLAALQKEMQFYRHHIGAEYLCSVLYNSENILALEQIEGVTLREFLISHLNDCDFSIKQILPALSNTFRELYQSSCPATTKDHRCLFYDTVWQTVCTLACSGPMFTKGFFTPFVSKLNYFITRLYKNRIRHCCSHLFESLPIESLRQVHRDLHLNNFLITPQKSLYVIDWENCSAGWWCNDFAYLFAQLSAFFSESDIKQLVTSVKNTLCAPEFVVFKKLYELYYLVISLNSRFWPRDRTISFWKNRILFPVHINKLLKSFDCIGETT